MNTKSIVLFAITLGAIAAALHAGPRTTVSGTYSILTDTVDAGGARSAGGPENLYTNDGSIGGVAGVSTVASPAETAKAGYIGQLYEITGFVVSAAPSTLNEGDGRQLNGWHLLDDATELAVDPTLVTWSVLSGPIASISAGGLATAGIVYQNTTASVRGTYLGAPSPFNLTVLNVTDDDFGSYAGDELNDAWQIQHFGLDNPLAAPGADPDGDGQDNRFEWNAGLIPTDASSAFNLSIVLNAGNATLRFGPTVAGRTYTVKYGFDFLNVPNWPTLPGGIITGIANELFVTDPNATASLRKFYRVEIAN